MISKLGPGGGATVNQVKKSKDRDGVTSGGEAGQLSSKLMQRTGIQWECETQKKLKASQNSCKVDGEINGEGFKRDEIREERRDRTMNIPVCDAQECEAWNLNQKAPFGRYSSGWDLSPNASWKPCKKQMCLPESDSPKCKHSHIFWESESRAGTDTCPCPGLHYMNKGVKCLWVWAVEQRHPGCQYWFRKWTASLYSWVSSTIPRT